jgi:hypothetical protein
VIQPTLNTSVPWRNRWWGMVVEEREKIERLTTCIQGGLVTNLP